MTDQVCGAPRANGGTCAVAFGLCDRCGLCWAHCEHRATERRAAQRKGGQTTRRQKERQERAADAYVDEDVALPKPQTIEDAKHWASWATWATATGQLDPRRAQQVVAGLREFRAATEKVDLARRLSDLERQLTEARKEKRHGE